MSDEQQNLELVRQLVALWNEGDIDGFLALHAEDVELITGPEWPEPSVRGKAAVARYAEEWRSAWDQLEMVLEPIVSNGELVACHGAWETRGAASGVAGTLPFGLLFTIRDGLVVRQRWCREPEEAEAELNLEQVRRMGDLWNEGRFDEMFELYSEDVEVITDPSWPEPSTRGKEEAVRGGERWREAWERITLDPQQVEANGDKVLVQGVWDTQGAQSGIGGTIPFGMVLTMGGGLLARQEWFMDPAEARRAAGLG
jgi:ketosteroid isomerase-like protein